MLWINEHKNVWRVAMLVVGLGAIMGPWLFDHLWVPPEYMCSAPYIRLDNNFCGTPLPGIWFFRWVAGAFVNASAGLVTGAMVFIDWVREFLFTLLLILLVLPFFSTMLVTLHGGRRRQVFNVAAWGLAAGIGLVLGMSSYPKLFWALWGIWLYIGLAASALILEVLVLRAERMSSQE